MEEARGAVRVPPAGCERIEVGDLCRVDGGLCGVGTGGMRGGVVADCGQCCGSDDV
jgi:hypothetical protein